MGGFGTGRRPAHPWTLKPARARRACGVRSAKRRLRSRLRARLLACVCAAGSRARGFCPAVATAGPAAGAKLRARLLACVCGRARAFVRVGVSVWARPACAPSGGPSGVIACVARDAPRLPAPSVRGGVAEA